MSSSNPPIAYVETTSVSVAGPQTFTGDILADDVDPAGLPLSVVSIDGVSITSTTTIDGTYGTLVISPDGDYTYTLNGSAPGVSGLTGNEVVTDAFTYAISDGQIYMTPTTEIEQNLISQSEAFNVSPWVSFGTAPVITANVGPGPNGGASTADQVTLSSANSGLYTATNVSGQYTFSVWVKLVSGSGTFSLNYYSGSTGAENLETIVATSTWQRVSLTFNGDGNAYSNVALMLSPSQGSAGTFEFWGAQLNAGATPDTYVATTGSPINTTTTIDTPVTVGSTLAVNVTGDGVVPTAAPDTAAVTEDGTLVATGNVLTNDTGPAGDPLSVASVNGVAITNTTTIAGTYGTLVISPDGDYTYTLANNQANVRSLANGQLVTDAFAYTISDGLPYTQTTTQTEQNLISQSEAFDSSIWSTLTPTGNPPTIVQANVGSGPGDANTADQIDLPGPGAQISTLTSVAGVYTFSVWVRLVSGSGVFALEYYASTSNTATVQTAVATSAWQRFSVTFTGDGGSASYVALLHTLYESGLGVFQLWGAQLNAGTTPGPYVATTGSTINTTGTLTNAPGSTLSVNVTGATPVAVADTASVAVQGTQVASGNLLANDTTPAGTTLSVVSVDGVAVNGQTTVSGTYGTLTVQPNGQYTYTLNAGAPWVQTLVGGQVEQDNFTYALSNGLVYDTTNTSVAENLLTQSQVFTNAVWIPFGPSGGVPKVTVTTDPGPLGGSTIADEVVLSKANAGICYVTNAPGEYTFSVWVRLISGNGNFSFNYYYSSGGVSYTQAAVATSGWQQFSWTFTGDGSANSNVALMHSGSQSTTGTFEIWGAELNPGGTADAYVPTSGSPASTIETATTPNTIGSTLSVAVSGPNSGQSGPALVLQNTTQGVVANLATDQMATPLTILPLGDSITLGWTQADWVSQNNLTSDPGYRGPLWQEFVGNGMLVNLIGPNQNGPASLPDPANAGFPGDTTAQILERLPGILAQQVPGAVLLMAGTNDVLQGVPQATIIANLTSMINMIAAASPSTQIYVATLTPLTADSVTSINAAITTMVSQASAAGQHVNLVSMSNVTSGDIGADGVHPTAAGYSLMAQNWYNAVIAHQADQGGTPGGTVTTIASSTVNLVGGSGPDLLLGNAGNNIITAGSGNDVLSGGGGNDTLVSGTGADQFDISAVSGNVTILGFNPAKGDFLDWNEIHGLTSSAILGGAATQSGGQTVINLASFGVNEQVTLENYTGNLNNSIFT
jgi:VCBS repeat-containing protein